MVVPGIVLVGGVLALAWRVNAQEILRATLEWIRQLGAAGPPRGAGQASPVLESIPEPATSWQVDG